MPTPLTPLARPALVILLVCLFAAAPTGQPASPVLTADLVAGLPLRSIGPTVIGGRTVDLAVVEASPSTFYAATATGGLWKTVDNGATFAPLFTHERSHSIGAVAVFQPNPEIVWVGSGEASNRQSSSWGDGVYKSTDGGRTWDNVGLRDSNHVGRVALHPTNPDVAFVAALGHLWGPNKERGLFKTIDGGKSWRNVLFVDNDTGVVDVAIDPSDPKVMFAAAYQRRRRAWGFHGGGPGSGLYKSSDGGDTWTKLVQGLPEGDKGRIGIAIYGKDPRIVYVCVEQGTRYEESTGYGERKAGVYRSDDQGESWSHMSDWNPRPMYASQIRVDPNDDARIYMVEELAYSDDRGKTFTVARQARGGGDRVVWIDPRDSKHLIKGDESGIAMSYDRGETWHRGPGLPASQFSRVSVDMRTPYWIYGGVQDHGSWAGPSAVVGSAAVSSEHWVRTGGGDGSYNVIDPSDNRTLYTSGQYLELSRYDLITGQHVEIRPGNPRGALEARRNWDTWGTTPRAAEPELGNVRPPANWDAPVLLSIHDPKILYAATNELWRSTDRGQSWATLGDRTTATDRTALRVMTQLPSETTLSLDDDAPYYPTISALAESPLRRGALYVGTDDGNVQVSRDSGRTWLNIGNRLPNLPKNSYVASIEASRHAESTVYIAFDNHRSNDYGNYLYRTTDGGATWTTIEGDLPSDRVIRVVREDPSNANLLYLGTERGAYVTLDQGQHWIELGSSLPRVPVNDLVVHPRDNDLVLATHGHGIWILDNLASLQGLTPEVLRSDAHLFPIEPAAMVRHRDGAPRPGATPFRGENPPAGAVVDYYLKAAAAKVTLTVHDAAGRPVAALAPAAKKGVNRVVWDLRHPPLGAGASGEPDASPAAVGAFVLPGSYTVRLTVNGKALDQPIEVREDPRLEVSAEVRKAWTDTALQLADLYRTTATMVTTAQALTGTTAAPADAGRGATDRRDLVRVTRELQSRVLRLYEAVIESISQPTLDQRAQVDHLSTLSHVIEARLRLAQGR